LCGLASVAASDDADAATALFELFRQPDHEWRLARPADADVADDDDRHRQLDDAQPTASISEPA
jgi:hypothetical protein